MEGQSLQYIKQSKDLFSAKNALDMRVLQLEGQMAKDTAQSSELSQAKIALDIRVHELESQLAKAVEQSEEMQKAKEILEGRNSLLMGDSKKYVQQSKKLFSARVVSDSRIKELEGLLLEGKAQSAKLMATMSTLEARVLELEGQMTKDKMYSIEISDAKIALDGQIAEMEIQMDIDKSTAQELFVAKNILNDSVLEMQDQLLKDRAHSEVILKDNERKCELSSNLWQIEKEELKATLTASEERAISLANIIDELQKNRVTEREARGQENLRNLRYLKESQYHKVLLEASMVELQSQVNDLKIQRDLLKNKASNNRTNITFKELDLELDNFELGAYDLDASHSSSRFGNDVSRIVSDDEFDSNDKNSNVNEEGIFFSVSMPEDNSSQSCFSVSNSEKSSNNMFRDVDSVCSSMIHSAYESDEDDDRVGGVNESKMGQDGSNRGDLSTSIYVPVSPEEKVNPSIVKSSLDSLIYHPISK